MYKAAELKLWMGSPRLRCIARFWLRKYINWLFKTTLPKAKVRIVEVNEIPEIGKISPGVFDELIFPRLGAKSDKVFIIG